MKTRFYREFLYPNPDFRLVKFHDADTFILRTPLWVDTKSIVKKLKTLPGCIGVIEVEESIFSKIVANQFFFACSMPRRELYDYLPKLIPEITMEPPQPEEDDEEKNSYLCENLDDYENLDNIPGVPGLEDW